MKNQLLILGVVIMLPFSLLAQDLNWNSVTYTTGNLTPNFGSIGTPASTVSLNITGNTNRIDVNFPIKYIANPPGGANDCAVNCALRSSVTFAAISETIVYTFTFSPAVSGISFRIYDIDGTNTSGDQANVTATGPSGAQNITMTNLNTPPSTITGSGTTSATVTGTQNNTTDHQTQVSISGFVSSLVITYANNPANPTAGNRSFSIGNMDWSGTLPVTFTQFSGQKIADGIVELKWKSENEINVEKYEIERSIDGINFVSAGFINTLSPDGRYSFRDNTPTRGALFYRVKEIDIDTRFQYSSIIALRFAAGTKPGITIFPSPASQHVFVTMNDNSLLDKLIIFSSEGKIMFQKNGPENKIDIHQLPAGLYRIKAISNTGEVSVSSFIKQ